MEMSRHLKMKFVRRSKHYLMEQLPNYTLIQGEVAQ